MSGGARAFLLPDLGEGLTEAVIVRWLVEVGEAVAIDQPVVEVETAKAQVEVPCPYGGVVTVRHGMEGEELPVGSPLITVAGSASGPLGSTTVDGAGGGRSAGEVAPGDAEATSPVAEDSTARAAGPKAGDPVSSGTARGQSVAGASPPDQPTGGDVSRRGVPSASDALDRGHEGGAAADEPSGDGGSGRVLVGFGTTEQAGATSARARRRMRLRDTVHTTNASVRTEPGGPLPVISPLVRRLAREHGIALAAVHGSGPEGLILRADVQRAIAGSAAPAKAASPAAGPAVEPAAPPSPEPVRGTGPRADTIPQQADAVSRVPLTGILGAAAEKFSRSRSEIPDATCWVDADATELLTVRKAMGEPGISLLAVLARITTAALVQYPQLNATVNAREREIVRLPAVHLGFAAQTDRGLVVPVVRDAHTLTTKQLHEEFARLTALARSGSLNPGQLTGSTFTLNNYGVFGVDGSTPILNHPEAGMLGIGRITEKPWAHQGQLELRQVVQLSFTFDHRVCDGGVAGGFLRWVADCVEQPARLLREV